MSVIEFKDFMLPTEGTDMRAWSVVACDQYTSSLEYWERVEKETQGKPSTLNLICPEARLHEVNEILPKIAEASERYARDLLVKYDGAVLVKRTLSKTVRWGIVCKIDLEAYTYDGSLTPIRATEGTVVERIPPRLAVKRASALDVSHVMCLIDDPECSVIEPLIEKIDGLRKLYDIDLMCGGGRSEGYHIKDVQPLIRSVNALMQKSEKAGMPFLLIGDGNHSLASAKALYEEYKASGDRRAERARYALVEIVNLQSDGINFEPIHRVLYGAPDFAEYLRKNVSGDGCYDLLIADGREKFSAPEDGAKAYEAVQKCIDAYLRTHGDAEVDYIHGEEDLIKLCKERKAVGVVMPSLTKNGFFGFVAEKGALPRKSFSMGEAYEKRYYLEVSYIGEKA